MLDSDIWKATKRKPFDKRSAWIDLLLRANHKKVTISIGNTLISLEPGQVFTSEVKLAKNWKWSRQKVRDFCRLCAEMGQIQTPKKTSRYTILTLSNWELYQSTNSEKDTKKNIQQTSKKHQKDTIKKSTKNVKNDKEVRYIVEYLNKSTDKNFKPESKSTQKLIKARLNEKYTVEDFENVIKCKTKDWKNTEMEKYLRPETLFNPTKFEGYLQESKNPTKEKANGRTNKRNTRDGWEESEKYKKAYS